MTDPGDAVPGVSASGPGGDEANLARIRSTYDAIAGEYDAHLSDELAHKPLDRALLGALVDLAAQGGAATIADIGCGPAHVTAHLAELHHDDVVGVDLSPAMIEYSAAMPDQQPSATGRRSMSATSRRSPGCRRRATAITD